MHQFMTVFIAKIVFCHSKTTEFYEECMTLP